jgi:hypothetical protein
VQANLGYITVNIHMTISSEKKHTHIKTLRSSESVSSIWSICVCIYTKESAVASWLIAFIRECVEYTSPFC